MLGAVNLLNFYYTQNIYYTRQVVLVNLCGLALCWLASEAVNTERRIRIILWVIIASACAVSIEGYAQVFLLRGILLPWQNNGALIGTIGNTNYMGAFLLFGIFACLSFLPRYWFSIIPLLLLIGGLVLARARASWVGATVGGVVWLWLTLPKRYFAIVVVVGCSVGVLAWYSMPEQWRKADTIGYRMKYWAAAVEMWKESPLLGIGFDGYRRRVYEAQAQINDRQKDFFKGYVDPKPRRVHNDYLQALVDGGLLYFGVWVGFIVWVMSKSYRAARVSATLRGIWVSSLSVLVAALFFFPFRVCDTVMLFYVQMGILSRCREE